MVAQSGTPTMEIERPLLSAVEAAHLLNVTPRQVYEWTVRRVIPDWVVVRVGRRVYYRRLALLAWLRGEAFPLDYATGDLSQEPIVRNANIR